MVLKRQLPSRVAPDAASTPSGTPGAPVTPNVDAEWPAAPAEVQAPQPTTSFASEIPALPPLPVLPPLPSIQPLAQAAPVPEVSAAPASIEAPVETIFETPAAPAVEAAPAEPIDTTPSMPSGDMSRRRVKTPRTFAEEAAPAAEAAAPRAPSKVANPIAEAPDRLANAGIIEAKVADELTANLPASAPSVELPADNIFALPPAPITAPVAAPTPSAPAVTPAMSAASAVPVMAVPIATAPLSAPASDLPWASSTSANTDSKSSSGWDIETPAPTPESPTISHAAASTPSAPPPDVFRDIASARPPEGPMPSMPWSTPSGGRAPELPTNSISSTPRGGSFQLLLAAAAVAGVLFVAYTLVTRTDRTQERLARLTGSLRDTPEMVAGSPSSTNPNLQPNLQPDKVVAMAGASGTILPPPAVAGGAQVAFQPLQPSTATSSSAVIDFTDVPPGEANQPIVADGSEKMPQDVGFVASLQQAIAKEKAKEGGQPGAIQAAEAAKTDDKNLTQEQKLKKGEDLKAQLDEELASYRKALADAPAPALAPKPTDFFKDKGYMDGKASAAASASSTMLLPPSATSGSMVTAGAGKAGVEGLPPAELYANNPKNLPVLPEPTEAEQPKVRQLADFDVNVFAPEEPKVRMPKGVKPQIAAGDFPALDILSLVPGRGLIAYYQGKEGVLLVGEKVAGWQLLGVNGSTAEFSSGEKHQMVRPD